MKPLIFLLFISLIIGILKDRFVSVYYLFNLPFIYIFEWEINLPIIIERIIVVILPFLTLFVGKLLSFSLKRESVPFLK